MPARYLLDANICIYALSGRSPALSRRFDLLQPGEAAISVIVYGELIFGAEKSSRQQDVLLRLEALTQITPVQPLPEAAAEHYGAIRAELEKRGKPIGNNDLWIAAHARAAGLILITNNESEFKRVPRLKVQNWVKPA